MNTTNIVPADSWRAKLAAWIESPRVQSFVIGVILVNAIVLGLETSPKITASTGTILKIIDEVCIAVFVLELLGKILAYRLSFWKNGWNIFDFAVIAVALVPGAEAWSVLRSMRVFRILRLLTVAPQLRQVVSACLHSIPGLLGVVAVQLVFFFTAGVLATSPFGSRFPDWFGSLGRSLYSLFQIMTLESWSMGIVRPVMAVYPLAWAFFVPFIIIATFTILNLFIGIIVSTMQQLSALPDPNQPKREIVDALARIEKDIVDLRKQVEAELTANRR